MEGDIEEILGDEHARKIVDLFHANPDRSFYVREIHRKTGVSLGTVHNKLKILRDRGIVRAEKRKRRLACSLTPRARDLITDVKYASTPFKKLLKDMRVIASSPRVAVLTGEYAVVKGYRGIALPLNLRTYIGIGENEEGGLSPLFYRVDPTDPGKPPEVVHDFYGAGDLNRFFNVIRDTLGLPLLEEESVSVTVVTEAPGHTGLALSASGMASLALAYARWLALHGEKNVIESGAGEPLREEESGWVCEAAKTCEAVLKGNLPYPSDAVEHVQQNRMSGIRSHASTMGNRVGTGLLFRRGEHPTEIPGDLKRLPLLLADSGMYREYREVENGVLAREESLRYQVDDTENPVHEGVYRAMDDVSRIAYNAIKTGDLRLLGELMDTQHELLSALGLSTDRLDQLCWTARRHGALGAKMIGSGKGGSIAALAPEDTLDSIKNALLRTTGVQILCDKIEYPVDGARIERIR